MRVETYQIRHGHNHILEWAWLKSKNAQALIFAPPLIGGHQSQQIRIFRRFTRQKYDLISFNYSGHGRSSDKFCLSATNRDTQIILEEAARISRKNRLPILGIATCYAAIPMLSSLHLLNEPIQKLVLINPIISLNPGSAIRSFIAYYRLLCRQTGRVRRMQEALNSYLDLMFPGITKDTEFFGGLARKRTRLIKTLMEFFTWHPLKTVRLENTKVLCLYAREDHILNSLNPSGRSDYINQIRSICPTASVQCLKGDHFLSMPETRRQAYNNMLAFFHEKSIYGPENSIQTV